MCALCDHCRTRPRIFAVPSHGTFWCQGKIPSLCHLCHIRIHPLQHCWVLAFSPWYTPWDPPYFCHWQQLVPVLGWVLALPWCAGNGQLTFKKSHTYSIQVSQWTRIVFLDRRWVSDRPRLDFLRNGHAAARDWATSHGKVWRIQLIVSLNGGYYCILFCLQIVIACISFPIFIIHNYFSCGYLLKWIEYSLS